jgi:hypothetical protein
MFYGSEKIIGSKAASRPQTSPITDPCPALDGPQGEIGTNAMRLESRISSLSHHLDSLQYRLNPILRPSYPTEASDPVEQPATEMAQFIFNCNARLDALISQVEHITNRVDL